MFNLKITNTSRSTHYKETDNPLGFLEERTLFRNEENQSARVERRQNNRNKNQNDSFEEFNNLMNNLRERSTDNAELNIIDYAIPNNRNLFKQLKNAFTEDLSTDNENNRMLAAEMTDALIDNPEFSSRFGVEAIRNPKNFFQNIAIRNNILYLEGQSAENNFEINLDNLRSARYQETYPNYMEELAQAQAEATAEATSLRAVVETSNEEQNTNETQTPEPEHTEPRAQEAVSEEIPNESLGELLKNGVENLNRFTFRVNLDDDDSHLIVRNSRGRATGNALNQNTPVPIPDFSETIELSNRAGRDGNTTYIKIGDDQYIHADYLQTSQTNGLSLIDTSTEQLSTTEETRTLNETPETETVDTDIVSEEGLVNSLHEGLNSLAHNIEGAVSSAFGSQERNPNRRERSREYRNTVSENHAEHAYLQTATEVALENPEAYTNFALHESMQNRQIAGPDKFRRAILNNRIPNSDQLLRYMDDLNLDLDELSAALHYRRGAGRDLDAGKNIDASFFLAQTNFANESFSEFLSRSQHLLSFTPNRMSEALRTEMSDRTMVFNRINHLIDFLKNINLDEGRENVDPISLSPDYITSARISSEASRTLNRAFRQERGNQRGRNPMQVAALYIQLYGPYEKLVNEGKIQITGNNNNTFQLTISEISDDEAANVARMYRLSEFGLRADYPSLTSAYAELRNSSNYDSMRRSIGLTRLENQEANASTQDQIFTFLQVAFDLQHTGPFFNGADRGHSSRRSLQMLDLAGRTENIDGTVENNYLAQQMSDNSIISYIINEISKEGPNGYEYSSEDFVNTINRLIRNGRASFRSINPNLSETERENIANAEEIDSSILGATHQLSRGQLDAIRYGVHYEFTSIDRERGTQESLSEMLNEEVTPLHRELFERWQNEMPGLEPQQYATLTRNTFHLLGNLDLSDMDNIQAGGGALVNLPLVSDDHFDVGIGTAVTPDNTIGGLTLTAQYQGEIAPGITAGVSTSESVTGIWTLYAGVTAELGNGYALNIGGGVIGGGAFGIPFANVDIGRSYESVVRRSTERAAEASEIDIPIDQITRINEMSDNEVLAIALNSPFFTTQVRAIQNETGMLSEPEQNNLLVESLRAYAQGIMNMGVENATGMGFKFGFALVGIPPVPIPYVGVTFRTREIMSFGRAHSTSEVERYAEQQIITQLTEQMGVENQVTNNYSFEALSPDGARITLDENGRASLDNSHTPLANINIENSSHEEITEQLNSETEEIGVHFLENQSNPEADYSFNLSDFAPDQINQGVRRTAQILVDGHSGIRTQIEENGEISVFFPENTIPRNFVVTRREINEPYGNSSRIIIALSTRPIDANTIMNNPYSPHEIFFDNTGEAHERAVLGSVETDYSYSLLDENDPRREAYGSPELDLNYEASERAQETVRVTLPFGIDNLEERANLGMRTLQSLSLRSNRIERQVQPEVSNLINKLLDDSDFMQNLARITTQLSEGGGEVDFELVATALRQALESEYPGVEFSNDILNFMTARLYPGTYLTLSEHHNRLNAVNDVINRVTPQIISNLINNRADLHYTSEQIQVLNDTIVRIATLHSPENDSLIQNLESSSISTERFAYDIANNLFTVAALRSNNANGLRHLIFDENNAPNIIAGSLEEYNLGNSDQLLVAEFLHQIYQPPFNPEAINWNLEPISADPNLQDILQSNYGLQFMDQTLNINGEQIPLFAAILEDPNDIQFVNDFYESMRGGTPIQNLEPGQREILNFLIRNIQAIQNAGMTNDQITFTNLSGEAVATVEVSTVAGHNLIHPCGNLTFYFDRQLGN